MVKRTFKHSKRHNDSFLTHLICRIIDFEKDPAFSNGEELPANSFSPGDVVSIRQDFQSSKKKRPNETDISVEGVVTRVHERHISVALKSEEDIPSSVTRLSV